MPDPTTKAELLHFMAAERSALEAALGRLSDAELHAPALPGEWSVKDAMAHIAHWELRVVERLQTCARGETPVRRTVSIDELNQAVYEENLGKPLTEVRQAFEDAHLTLLQEVERLSEADLFDAARRAAVMGDDRTPVWDRISAESYLHYEEHRLALEAAFPA